MSPGPPSGPMIKNPLAHAGDMGLISVQEGLMPWGKASSQATTSEVHAPRAHTLQQEKPWQQETHRYSERVTPTLTYS